MHAGKMIGAAVICLILGILVFHIVHYVLYCRYRAVPGKSHCSACGHRNVCNKYHHKFKERQDEED